ncbi:hypothetical protein QN372_16300 [Undibacterium sp. RTI2.1]|uniref:DUF7482 domain-containing protein n=1 Tax=unclassified Undibacterium TaxID=2630295 RepID=UPI002AB57A50|nr:MULTISPECIES: hypothetical protein [unclassified Undibacterium]MDY7538780.1 hypothetical protein [Undibacterium sp. 5I1]MEB0032318.1 hypothetical protein [Undibacterium sp. RTI2.1]MEB0118233.1 hypothetical protein [Undibacterium sp. RTI2.2]MEB0229719.1 hypothetical protein [Undibacterium sp. 10I3]MEB0258416.1 hypothetical protein [Undibacterium sp. 5I1]
MQSRFQSVRTQFNQLGIATCAIALSMMFSSQAGYAAPDTNSDLSKLNEKSVATVEIPLLAGWYQGHLVHYISTDMSDQKMAQQADTNYVSRLSNVLRAPVPGQPSAVDRVYKLSNFEQGSVFPSAPESVGYRNKSEAYTPLWVVYMVTWRDTTKAHVLKSEEEVLDATEKQLVDLTPTKIVVNCPILYSAKDGLLSGLKIHIK